MARDLMKPARQFQLALLALALALAGIAPAQAQGADSALFKAEIQRLTDSLATSFGGAVKWTGSEPYQVRQEGNALVAVIRHARLAVKSEHLSGEIGLGPIAIRRTVEPGGKTIDFAVRLPSEITFQGPGPTGPAVLAKIALKDAKADAVIEAQSELTRAATLSAAAGRIDMPTTGAWIRFGPLSMESKIVAEPNGGWRGPSDFELKRVEFVLPLGAVGGIIKRIAYQGKSAGPNLAALHKLRITMSTLHHKGASGRKANLAAFLAALGAFPEVLGTFGIDIVVEGVAVHGPTGKALGSLKKAEFAVKVAGLDDKATSLRLTSSEEGLSVSPSLADGVPVPDRVVIDLGLEDLSNQALHAILGAAAATPLGGQANAQQRQKERQQLLGAAAKLEPVFRVYDIGVDTKEVGLDLSGQASGSPLASKGYTATGDLVVRGFAAIARFNPPPTLSQYLPLLRAIAIAAKAPDGTKRLRFHLASTPNQWIAVNGNDVRAWFAPPAQRPGERRLLRLVYPPLKGADVKRVQRALAAAKITVPENGAYDGETAAAVARFQKEKGLNVSGVVDAATRKKLEIGPPSAAPAQLSQAAAMPRNLSGRWTCDDGGTYYLRQVGNVVWWYGESSPVSPRWSNVAHGSYQGRRLQLDWADVPKGPNSGGGTLVLSVMSPDKLVATSKTGGFGGGVWTRAAH
jgi:Putative peptidoglycan binding domain